MNRGFQRFQGNQGVCYKYSSVSLVPSVSLVSSIFMNILFLRFPLESTLGGAEIQTLTLMEGLIKRGHTVSFAGSCPTLLKECAKRKIPTTKLEIGIPPVTKGGALSFIWRKRAMRKKLTQFLDRFSQASKPVNQQTRKPDIICMLSLSEKLLLTNAAHQRGIKPVWIEHDRIGRWLSGNPWLKLLLKQSRNATTVTVSELSARMYVDLGWKKKDVVAIPNGIDTSRIEHRPRKTSKPANQQTRTLRVGCISRLSPEKGVDVLIHAMSAVPESITLEIVGKGPEEKSLHSLVRSLKLNDRIAFSAQSPDLSKILNRFDALVLPSRDHDPFGLVAAEAMMFGLPVIVTDACGIADELTHKKDVLIVPVDNHAALSKAILSLSDQATRVKLADQGKKTAEKKFSAKQMVDRYVVLFTGASSSH